MKHRTGKVCLITLAMVFAAGVSHAYQQKTEAATKPATGGQTPHAVSGGKPQAAKVPAAMKWVDINSASLAELKTLPRIDDVLAKKIIAGRPYKSKAFLITNKIIPPGAYQAIRDRIIAKQK